MASPSIVALGTVQALRLTLGFLSAVIATRWLGPVGWGQLSLARSAAQTWWFLASLGAADLVTRAVSRDATAGLRILRTLRRALIPAGGAATLCITVTLVWIDGTPLVLALGAAAAIPLLFGAFHVLDDAALLGVRSAHESIRPMAISRAVHLAVLVASLAAGAGVWSVLVAASVSEGLLAAMLLRARVRRLGPWPEGRAAPLRRVVRQASPYTVNLLFGTLYLTGDVLVLGAMRSHEEVGLYQGAALLALHLPIVAQVVSRGLLPRIATATVYEATQMLRLACRVLWAISIPVAVGGILLANPLMETLLGAEWSGAAGPLVFLMATVPLWFIENNLAGVLTARGHQRARAQAVAGAALFNLSLNIAVIPTYGATGAAATMLVTEVGLYGVIWWHVRRLGIFAEIHAAVPRIALATLAMAMALSAVPDAHIGWQVALGAVSYGFAGLALGAFRLQDVPALLRL